MNFLFACGGTAGHINPALAIADKIRAVFPASEILFIGTPGGMEAQLVTKAGYAFTGVKLAGLQRSVSIKDLRLNAKAACYLITSAPQIRKIIKKFKPTAVIGTGGYVSLPVLREAARMGIVTVAHESNALPGMSTRVLSRYVSRLFLASDDAVQYIPERFRGKCVITGNPLRAGNILDDREDARRKIGLPEGFTILSFGGSLGSPVITESVITLFDWENQVGGINHIHACGGGRSGAFAAALAARGVKPDPARTIISDYIYNMYTCYSAADLVISRSGSMTQTELKAAARASVQIPWSGATDNHQFYNAASMAKRGAALLIEDRDLSPESLLSAVQSLYNDRPALEKMSRAAGEMAFPDSAGQIVSGLLDIIR